MSPLTNACITGNPAYVETAISNGHRPDHSTLDTALRTGNPKIVELVCRAGALPSQQSLTSGCQTRNTEIVDLLIMQGAKNTSNTFTAALKTQNLSILYKICTLGGAIADESTLEAACQLPAGNDYEHYFQETLKLRPQDAFKALNAIKWGECSEDRFSRLVAEGARFAPVYPYRFEVAELCAKGFMGRYYGANHVDSTRYAGLAKRAKLVSERDFQAFTEMLRLESEAEKIDEQLKDRDAYPHQDTPEVLRLEGIAGKKRNTARAMRDLKDRFNYEAYSMERPFFGQMLITFEAAS